MESLSTQKKLNRPIKFFGLSSLQFLSVCVSGAIIIVIEIFASCSPIIIVLTIFFLVVTFTYVFAKMRLAYKNGNNNYIESKLVKDHTPLKIIDKNCFFKYILLKHE